jgi:hypothetical protein
VAAYNIAMPQFGQTAIFHQLAPLLIRFAVIRKFRSFKQHLHWVTLQKIPKLGNIQSLYASELTHPKK